MLQSEHAVGPVAQSHHPTCARRRDRRLGGVLVSLVEEPGPPATSTTGTSLALIAQGEKTLVLYHYADTIRVEELAKLSGLSTSAFHRSFMRSPP